MSRTQYLIESHLIITITLQSRPHQPCFRKYVTPRSLSWKWQSQDSNLGLLNPKVQAKINGASIRFSIREWSLANARFSQGPQCSEASSGLHLSHGFAGPEGHLSRGVETPGPRTASGNPIQDLLPGHNQSSCHPGNRGFLSVVGNPLQIPTLAPASSLGDTCQLGNEEKPLVESSN